MQFYLAILLLLISPLILGAQESIISSKDIIILKNNSKLEGQLLEVSKRSIYFKVASVVYNIRKKEILSLYQNGQEITFSAPIALTKYSSSSLIYEIKMKKDPFKRGFYNISYGNISESLLGIQNVSGYQFNKNVGLGLGIGFMDYMDFREEFKAVPIFSEIRGYFTDKKVSAYYNLAIGLNMGLNSKSDFDMKNKGAMFFHPALGYKVGSNAAAFMLDLGIQVSNLSSILEPNISDVAVSRKFQGVVLRLGIML